MIHPKFIVSVAVLASTLATVAVVAALAVLRRKYARPVLRVVLSAAILVAVLASVGLVDLLVLRLNTTEGLGRVFIDPGSTMKSVPAIAAAFLLLAMELRTRRKV